VFLINVVLLAAVLVYTSLQDLLLFQTIITKIGSLTFCSNDNIFVVVTAKCLGGQFFCGT